MSSLSPHDLPPELREDAPWWRRNLSLIVLTGSFALLALMVPMEWIERVQNIFKVEPINTQAPFMDSTARLDEALERGEAISEQTLLRDRRTDIIIRRLLKAGPLNGEEVKEVKRMLLEVDAQAAKETTEATKQAWHAQRLRKLERDYPRLDPEKTRETIAQFESQYARALTPQ
jgi:hypothetical protein